MFGRLRALRAREAEVRRLRRRVDKLERDIAKRGAGRAPRTAPPDTVALEWPGGDLRLEAPSKMARKRRLAAGKEPWTVAWLEGPVAGGGVLYDIGANVGPYALIAAVASQGRTRVLAFEPSFSSYASLCRNVLLNGLQEQVTPMPVTLGRRSEMGVFRYADLTEGAALHAGGDAELARDAVDSRYDQPVLVMTIDDLVERYGVPAPTHLKIDVDGAEVAVLEGARRTLARESTRSVLIEIGREQAGAVEEQLRAAGLRLSATHPEGAREQRDFWYATFDRA